MGPQRGHIRATNDQIAADNSGHHRSGMPQVIGRTGPSTAGNRNPPVLSRTEEARGSNPLTSTPQQPWSPAWRVVSAGPTPSQIPLPGSKRAATPTETAPLLDRGHDDVVKRGQDSRPSDYEATANRKARTGWAR